MMSKAMDQATDTVIIEDDENVVLSLRMEIEQNFPQLHLVGTANSVESGVDLLKKCRPKLIFMDINLPDGNAFDIFERADAHGAKVIFTTAYSEFAVRAFEMSAMHYLVKPLSQEKIAEAVERFEVQNGSQMIDEKLTVLKESLMERPQKIMLPSSDGTYICNISDIIRCQAQSNYTMVFFSSKESILVAKNLGKFETLLLDVGFARPHSSHLVNMKYIKVFHTGLNSILKLTDGTEVPVSSSFRKTFHDSLLKYAKSLK